MTENKNILFLGDPNSIHDRKWMTWLARHVEVKCFLVYRESHANFADNHREEIENSGIQILESIRDYAVFKPWNNYPVKRRLKQIIEQHKIGICQVYYAEPNALWIRFLNAQGVKTFLTTRGSDVLVGFRKFAAGSGFKDKKLWKSYTQCLKGAHQIFSTSKQQQNWLSTHIPGIREPKVIRTGIDMKAIQEVKKVAKRWDKRIFFPRNMQPLYQHELAIETILNLPQEIQRDYVFTFVNKNSPNTAYVSRIQELMDANSHIRFEFLDLLSGSVYYEYIYHSALVVMTPKSDGSPVSAMETLALETPLILPDLGFDTELFRNAFFYNPGKPEELGIRIQSILGNQTAIPSDLGEMDAEVQMKHVLKSIYD